MLKTYSASSWEEHYPDLTQLEAIEALEDGKILFFPQLTFELKPDEGRFLTPDCADPKAKNVGYDHKSNRIWGVRELDDGERLALKAMLERFSQHAYGLIKAIFPHYGRQVTIGRTSFRPMNVSDRKTSYRKDDRRLHIDAFPSAPNQGQRILRVFSNINPNGEDRVWRVGEPFEDVAKRFIPQISKPCPGWARLLRFLHITKSYRTAYDHYMLHMHDKMKADDDYQQNAPQEELRLPSGSTWIVQTDHVPHAAMQGQFMLEQTFYLPVKAMQDENKAPLRILERILKRTLV